MRVPAELADERLDVVVARLNQVSRARAADAVRAGSVLVNGAVVTRRSQRVAADSDVDAHFESDPEPPAMEPDADVVFAAVHEDDDVVVVDKPPDLVVHPGAGHHAGTLAHGLIARYPEIAGVGEPDRPGLVHRLDKGTSGLLVVARTEEAHASLKAQLAARTMQRTYRALAWGHLPAATGLIDAPIGRSRRVRVKMAVAAGGRPARTRYRSRRRFDDPDAITELELELETGRTHQIRVHLASIDHPVVGDDRYGGRRGRLPVPRPMLHAERLSIDHPTTGLRLTVESPLPPDFEAVLARLS